MLDNPWTPYRTGTYAGNDAVNRAIPHGLGRVPKLVIVASLDAASGVNMSGFTYTDAALHNIAAGINYAVTAPTSTNFYVGNVANLPNSMNVSTVNYTWIAF